MDLALSDDELAFRDEARAWLDANVEPTPSFADFDEEFAWGRQWQARLAADRWVGIHWPTEYGGSQRDADRGRDLQHGVRPFEGAPAGEPDGREPGRDPPCWRTAPTSRSGGGLPGILTAEEIWCQLFSEPGAGSDLASLTTRATPVDDGWVLNGQKVWTSYAQFSRWGIALVRTDPDAPRHRGISYVVVDMEAPGIEVRPLVTMTAEAEFNEVFFDDVFVPGDHLVGGLNNGWAVANTTLAHERGTTFPFKEQVVHEVYLDELLSLAESNGSFDDPLVADRTGRRLRAAAGPASAQLADDDAADPRRGARPGVERGEAGVVRHDPCSCPTSRSTSWVTPRRCGVRRTPTRPTASGSASGCGARRRRSPAGRPRCSARSSASACSASRA